MQKVIAVFLASLLLLPAGSFAQESKGNGTLRESAIRHARLAAAIDAAAQAPKRPSFPRRHPVGFGTLMGMAAGTVGAVAYCANTDNYGDIPCEWNALPIGVVAGAATGALTGYIVGAIRGPADPRAPSFSSQHPIGSAVLWGTGIGAGGGAAVGLASGQNPAVSAIGGAAWGSLAGLIVGVVRRD